MVTGIRFPRSRDVSIMRAAIIASPLFIKKTLIRATGRSSQVHDGDSPVTTTISTSTAKAGIAATSSARATDSGIKHLGKRRARIRPVLRTIDFDPEVNVLEMKTNVKIPLVKKAT